MTIKTKGMKAVLFAAAMAAMPAQAAEKGGDSALRDAERMIARCLDYVAAQKLTPFSVGVIDVSGTLVAFKRQDGASAATAEAALLKARTALRLNAPTEVLGAVAAADAPTRDAFLVMQMTSLPGGMPLADDQGRAVGAVGVSGGTAEQDAECARRAAAPAPAKSK
ncbi:heme-binding protein [Solimonas sp. SE-A11]|uniref:GlcG/HbpS family heme-binding protein n=1 Tax=Solimonas sp. SE-A11 TaxID=3054954 RepID=UPI00259D2AF2|nr:heme-binding protein [Solimonas sp. SE-A11]